MSLEVFLSFQLSGIVYVEPVLFLHIKCLVHLPSEAIFLLPEGLPLHFIWIVESVCQFLQKCLLSLWLGLQAIHQFGRTACDEHCHAVPLMKYLYSFESFQLHLLFLPSSRSKCNCKKQHRAITCLIPTSTSNILKNNSAVSQPGYWH